MNASELIALFRALHPKISGYVQETIDAKWYTKERDTAFDVFMDLHRCISADSHLFGEAVLKKLGLLIERAIEEGDEFVSNAVCTAIVESFCHWMNHEDPSVLPIAPHLGRNAFEHIEAYSKFMHGNDEENWTWVEFLKKNNIPRVKVK